MRYNNDHHEKEEPSKRKNMPDYEVGYKKPPKSRQFPKGQSGNLKGRPKSTKNFKTDLQEELVEQIRVTEGGKTVVMSKQRAMIKRTMELSLKGNLQATQLLAKLIPVYLEMDEEQEGTERLSHDDRTILERFLEERAQADADQKTKGDET